MGERPKVMVVGSANMDLVFQCDQIPISGETRLGHGFRSVPGGKGANQAVAIGRLGGEVVFVGKVGDDANGQALLDSLRTSGVDVSKVRIEPHIPSGVAGIIVDDSGHNCIVVAPGSNARLRPDEVSDAIRACVPTVVLVQLEIPLETVLACADAYFLILNPAPAAPLPDELLGGVSVITPNESETHALTGTPPVDEDSCAKAAGWFHDRSVKTVVLTLGELGCYVSEGGRSAIYSPPAVEVVDTTAAGDAFSGALAYFLSEGREIWNAAPLANHVAALSAMRRGAQDSMPSFEELATIARHLL
jgi:ribokinase